MLKVVLVKASYPDLIFLLEAIGAGLFWHANEEDICCMQMRGPQLRANRFFPCPGAFLLLLYRISWGFRVSHTFPLGSLTPAAHPAPGGSCGEAAQAPWGAVQGRPCHWSCAGRSGCWRCKGWATLAVDHRLSQADFKDLPREGLARSHHPGQPHSVFVVLRYCHWKIGYCVQAVTS